MLYGLARPALFALPPETAHALAAAGLRLAHRHSGLRRLLRASLGPPDPVLETRCLGLTFPSPLGLAAGFDKHCAMYNALGALGFGAVEVGTITRYAQQGNPRPRLFRLGMDRALVNRMGFNNIGADGAARALASHAPESVVLGVNLGKSRVTPLDVAADDYAYSAERLSPYAQYLVVNVSSPNTPGLRALQHAELLAPIVRAVRGACAAPRPLLVKVAPDLDDEAVDALTDLCVAEGVDGVIAANTTLQRGGLRTPEAAVRALGEGGLSGPPLRDRTRALVARVYLRARGALTVIGVGGVSTADDVWALLAAGASLVQVYTGFIYGGPAFPSRLAAELAARLRQQGLDGPGALVGRDHRAPGGQAP